MGVLQQGLDFTLHGQNMFFAKDLWDCYSLCLTVHMNGSARFGIYLLPGCNSDTIGLGSLGPS